MSYTVPNYEVPLNSGPQRQTHNSWYRFFQGVYQGQPPSNESTVSVGGSPFMFTAPSKGYVILNGGSVSAVQFTRSVTTLTGQTAGIFPLNQGDVLTVTYASLPTMTFVPQ